MKNTKAIIYARQSSGKDDVSESVEAQVKNCRELARREQLEVIAVCRDLNISGETYPVGFEEIAMFDSAYREWAEAQSGKKGFRPGLAEALSRLGEAQYLIVNELTRLYRPITGAFLEGIINLRLKKNNVKVIQVQGGVIDLTHFDQQLITTIKNQILYDDLQKKRANSILAFRNKRDSGLLPNGCRAYGIRYLGKDRMELKPESIPVIRFIFQEVVTYRSYLAIIRECLRRFPDEKTLRPTSIYRIVRQPLYCGYMRDSAGFLIPNRQLTGPHAVTFTCWSQAQRVLNFKRTGVFGRAKKHWLPFSGKLHCAACGSKLVCAIDRGKIFYNCPNATLTPSDSPCRQVRIRMSGTVEKPELMETVRPFLVIGWFAEQNRLHEKAEIRNNAAQFRDRLEKMKKKERAAFELFSEDLLSREQLEDMLREHKSKREHLEFLMMEAEDPAPPEMDNKENREKIFHEICDGTLPENEYSALLNQAELSFSVGGTFVRITSAAGSVTLPRINCPHHRFLPPLEFVAKKPEKTVMLRYQNGNMKHIIAISNIKIWEYEK